VSEESKRIIDFLNCDYETFGSDDDIEKVIKRFNELSAKGKTEGFYPVIIIPTDTFAELFDIIADEIVDSTQKSVISYRNNIISKANEINAEKFLRDKLNQYLGYYNDFDITGSLKRQSETIDLLGYLTRYYGRDFDEIVIALIPAENPWELAAWIPIGGVNDCPRPEYQVAVFRYWHDKYNAVPILATFDTWMMSLTKPPVTDIEVESLAKEQFAFCSDIVSQGSETILGLASGLRNSTTWFFWWD